MSKSSSRTFVFAFAATVTLSGGAAFAQSSTSGFVPFDTFIGRVASAAPAAMVGAADSRVSDPAEADRIRSHVLGLYRGVSATHSFVADGQHFDCVPLMQQPTVRALGLKSIASPPPTPTGAATGPSQFAPDEKADAFGNATACADGTIPMRRVTPEEIARFGTLKAFFAKGPGDAGRYTPPRDFSRTEAAATHKYAHAYQTITNYGGVSDLALWSPLITASKTHIFSLSQHWYVNYKGSKVQTAETGWQNYPGKYGVNKSVLFVYWTADGYGSTGCYNMDCAGFVQYDKTIYLGKGWSVYSTDGGTQYQITLKYQLYNGNWWVGLGNKWAGYYPATLYGTGLMKTSAKSIDFGGETVGTTNWPPMGGSKFASTGFKHAAFHKNIHYFSNGQTSTVKAANLTKAEPSPKCYTDDMHNNSGGSWGSYFYYGGPGGTGC